MNLLAKRINETLDFAALPVLADALQEAGCDYADLLNRLRDPNATHVRGCWALDLVLGRDAEVMRIRFDDDECEGDEQA